MINSPETMGFFLTWVFGYIVFKQAAPVAEGFVTDFTVYKV